MSPGCEREQQNLTRVIGTVRGKRQQWEWLGITAAAALMKSSNPAGWATLAAELNLAEANHDALSTCRETAAKTKTEQHCSIVVPPPAGDPTP